MDVGRATERSHCCCWEKADGWGLLAHSAFSTVWFPEIYTPV